MHRKLFIVVLCLFLATAACALPGRQAAPPAAQPTKIAGAPDCPALSANACGAPQPVAVQGTFAFTNDIILTYYVENAASLTDLYGFVKRDKDWKVPTTSQNLGYLTIDAQKKTGAFLIDLPAQPTGTLVNVHPNSQDTGVQIFAAEYMPNLSGSPYSTGDDAERGWPTYLASVKTDSENKDEVTGGKLVVWSPDERQSFPSAFGADGLLFSADDPVMALPRGYSVIDLDQQPFQIIRDSQPEMTLYEPKDAAIKDFSALSYTDAFDQMFAMVRKEYAFNGVTGKPPDWDALYARLQPRVQQADQHKDAQAYYAVLRDFTLAFHDGHIGLSGGSIGQQALRKQFAGGYGFAIRMLDDGRAMVIFVLANGPAEKAGMKPGAVLSAWNGNPVDAAIQAVNPPTAPHSMPSTQRFEQARYLVRAPLNTTVSVTFTNPGSSTPQTASLISIEEQDSISATSPYRNIDPNGLPVEYTAASSIGVGYVHLLSNYDDLNLVVRLFQRALEKFQENNLPTLIVDLRGNSGGAPLGLAGFLTTHEIPLGQLQYYSEKTGQFEAEGSPDSVLPNQEQYHFEKIILLVDQACASACELEAYGFSQLPGAIVVGETGTSGTEAEVSRGQFVLPDGLKLQIPTGRFVLPDGSIFLEGKGVPPTLRIPMDETNAQLLMNNQDPVLSKALELAKQ